MSVLQDTHLYAIAGNPNDKRKFLMKDGFSVTCCIIPPYAEVSSVSQKLEYKRLQCSTECPHASVMANDKGQFVYLITCQGSVRQHRLATEEELRAWEENENGQQAPKSGMIII
jgi:hypothetical protein